MTETLIAFSRYLIALIFGSVLAVRFAGMTGTRRNNLVFGGFILGLFVLQLFCLKTWGMSVTLKIYPLISHLPVVLFIAFYLKRTWLISFTSMFVSFLCCQPPRWIGAVAGEIVYSASADHALYILSAFLTYFLLDKHALGSVRHLMERSVKSCLLFGAMPAFYYLFDYTATVYTNFMYSGSRAAIQFMPSAAATFYFVFVLLYYVETQKQANTQRERDMLDMQLTQAQKEFVSLRQNQQSAATYRHDMRHHLAFIQGLATGGRIEEIREYLSTTQSDLDAITPMRFCENETVNLILAAFAAKAKQAEIQFEAEARLPEAFPFSDTELCSLLSNALENAILASEKIDDRGNRCIRLRVYSKNNKLCIDIRNRYQAEPVFHKGIPVSEEKGHGYGTKSMANIVEKHGGVFRFMVNDGWFIFQATA